MTRRDEDAASRGRACQCGMPDMPGMCPGPANCVVNRASSPAPSGLRLFHAGLGILAALAVVIFTATAWSL